MGMRWRNAHAGWRQVSVLRAGPVTRGPSQGGERGYSALLASPSPLFLLSYFLVFSSFRPSREAHVHQIYRDILASCQYSFISGVFFDHV